MCQCKRISTCMFSRLSLLLPLPRRSSLDEPQGSWHLTAVSLATLSTSFQESFPLMTLLQGGSLQQSTTTLCWPKMLWICNSCLRTSFGAQKIKGWLEAFYLTHLSLSQLFLLSGEGCDLCRRLNALFAFSPSDMPQSSTSSPSNTFSYHFNYYLFSCSCSSDKIQN